MALLTQTIMPGAGNDLSGRSFAKGFMAANTELEKYVNNIMKTCRKTSCVANCKHKTATCAAPASMDSF